MKTRVSLKYFVTDFIIHCLKRVRIRIYSGLHSSVRMRENTNQNNSEYKHFLCIDSADEPRSALK